MAIDPNDKELTVWGFTKGMRTGLITFILALLIMAVMYLFSLIMEIQKERYNDQEKRIQEMREMLQPTTERMNNVANKVDTAASKVITTSEKVDSITNELNNRKNLK